MRAVARFFIAAVCGLSFFGSWAHAVNAGAKPVRMAVVDVAEVFEKYDRTKKLNETVKRRFSGRQKAIEGRKAKLQKQKMALDNDSRRRNDPSLIQAKAMLQMDASKYETDLKAFLTEYEKFQFAKTRHILAEIVEAVRRYAEGKGYDIVLQVTDTKVEGRNTMSLTNNFRKKTAVYFSDHVNITPGVLAFLNQAYEQKLILVPEEEIEGERKK